MSMVKPRNFMLKHQDYFQQKSYMIADLNNMTINEQKYLENKRLREEAKKRLEHSLELQAKINRVNNPSGEDGGVSAYQKAQYMKIKLNRYMKEVEKNRRQEYKLPDLGSIVSRNCNNSTIENVIKYVDAGKEEDNRLVPVPIQKLVKENTNIPPKSYSVQQMLMYRGTKRDKDLGQTGHQRLLKMNLPLQLANISVNRDPQHQLRILRNLKGTLTNDTPEKWSKTFKDVS